jgi:hypothetical protein
MFKVPAMPGCDCDACFSGPTPVATSPFFADEVTVHEGYGACGFEHVTTAPCPPHEAIKRGIDGSYPWYSQKGLEVSAGGWAYGCDCATCLDRRWAGLPRS